MLGQRIDFLITFYKGVPDKELCWCRGKVIEVAANTNKPNTLKVFLDPMPHSNKYKEPLTSTIDLLPMLWNKNKDQLWRLDIDLTVMAESGDAGSDYRSKNKKVKLRVMMKVTM